MIPTMEDLVRERQHKIDLPIVRQALRSLPERFKGLVESEESEFQYYVGWRTYRIGCFVVRVDGSHSVTVSVVSRDGTLVPICER